MYIYIYTFTVFRQSQVKNTATKNTSNVYIIYLCISAYLSVNINIIAL